MRKIILFFILSFIYSQDKKMKFDLDKLKDPDPKWPIFSSPITSKPLNSSLLDSIKSIQTITEGFRIQLLATKDRMNAEKLLNELSVLYEEEIYIIFEAPNYKVRIGNYIDRKDAEKVRNFLTNRGFPSAWIVRTKIQTGNSL